MYIQIKDSMICKEEVAAITPFDEQSNIDYPNGIYGIAIIFRNSDSRININFPSEHERNIALEELISKFSHEIL